MLQLQRHKGLLCAPPRVFECRNLAAPEAHPLAGQEAGTCPSPARHMLPGSSPSPQHREENPVQPGASSGAGQQASYLVFLLQQQAGGAVTCLFVRFGLFVFLVLIADQCYKGNQRATLRQHSVDTAYSLRTFEMQTV